MKINKTKLKNNSSGFGHFELILGALVVAIIGVVGYTVYINHNSSTATATATTKAVNKGWHIIGNYVSSYPSSQNSTNWDISSVNIFACKQPVSGLGQNIKIHLSFNPTSQLQGKGIYLNPKDYPSSPSYQVPVTEVALQAYRGKTLLQTVTAPINYSSGGAGGGNMITRTQDLPSVDLQLTQKANKYRVYFFQHGDAAGSIPAFTYISYPHADSSYVDFNVGPQPLTSAWKCDGSISQ